MVLSQLIVNAVIAGSIYALMAAGFSIIYTTNRFLHVAHGVAVSIGSYLLYLFFTLIGLPFIISATLAIIITGFVGVGMNYFIYRPLKKRNSSAIALLIASVALLLILENTLALIFGTNIRTIDFLSVGAGINFLGAFITPIQIVIVAVALVSLVVFYLIMYRTRLGCEMRAVSDNYELARISGINDVRITHYAFFIGTALAGVAGVLIGLEQFLAPGGNINPIIKAFTATVIGGMTSVPGAIIGSYILGLAENLGEWFISAAFKDAIAFILLFLFLLFKPTGLFGSKKGVKQ